MTDTITPASLLEHADWIDGCGHGLGPGEALRAEAARLEAEAARDEEAEQLAKVMLAAEREHWLSVGMNRYEDGFQGLTGDFRVAYLNAASKVRGIAEWLIAEAVHREHARLAADGRLLPEGGTVLTAEQWADVRISCGVDDVKPSEFVKAEGRLRRLAYGQPPEVREIGWYRTMTPRFATEHFDFPIPTAEKHVAEDGGKWVFDGQLEQWELREYPPAVPVPLELPTEPGSRIRASVKRWGSAREWADTDPYVDTFTLGERDIWHAENECLVVGAWNREYITVLEVLPAVSVPDIGPDGTPEKPWPTWQDVPEGVRYWGRNRLYRWVNRDGRRMFLPLSGGEVWSSRNEPEMQRLAPFVRVDGGKA